MKNVSLSGKLGGLARMPNGPIITGYEVGICKTITIVLKQNCPALSENSRYPWWPVRPLSFGQFMFTRVYSVWKLHAEKFNHPHTHTGAGRPKITNRLSHTAGLIRKSPAVSDCQFCPASQYSQSCLPSALSLVQISRNFVSSRISFIFPYLFTYLFTYCVPQ